MQVAQKPRKPDERWWMMDVQALNGRLVYFALRIAGANKPPAKNLLFFHSYYRLALEGWTKERQGTGGRGESYTHRPDVHASKFQDPHLLFVQCVSSTPGTDRRCQIRVEMMIADFASIIKSSP